MLISYSLMLPVINDDTAPPPTPEIVQIKTSINYLLLFQYSSWAVFMTSFLSPFQKSITAVKRIILLIICYVPVILGTLYCISDQSQNSQSIRHLLVVLVMLIFLYGPPILLGKSSFELYPRLLRKIPLPWFQIPEQEYRKAD